MRTAKIGPDLMLFHASEHISHSRFLAAGTRYVACNAELSVIKANKKSMHYFVSRKCLKNRIVMLPNEVQLATCQVAFTKL